MFPVNAAQSSPSREHHQNSLRLGIASVILEVEDDSEFDSVKFLGPVALFACVAGGH
jgi:hypothetical protein